MSYISLPTEQGAKTRSAAGWNAVLGRAKLAQDITEFLWGTIVDIDGKALLVVEGNEEQLTPQDTISADIPPAYSTLFVLITSTVGVVTTFMENRELIVRNAAGQWVPRVTGLAWQQKPNPILINGVPDTRSVFLLRFTRAARRDDYDGTVSSDKWQFSKLAKWVLNNSSVQTAPASHTINEQPAGNAYKITGQNVWLVRDNPERFGAWEDETVEPVQLMDGSTDLGVGHGST